MKNLKINSAKLTYLTSPAHEISCIRGMKYKWRREDETRAETETGKTVWMFRVESPGNLIKVSLLPALIYARVGRLSKGCFNWGPSSVYSSLINPSVKTRVNTSWPDVKTIKPVRESCDGRSKRN